MQATRARRGRVAPLLVSRTDKTPVVTSVSSVSCPLVSCLSPGLCLYKEHQGEETGDGRTDGAGSPLGSFFPP